VCPDAGAIGDCVLPCSRCRNAGHSFRENASNKRILPIWPGTESKNAALVWPTSGSQISTATRSTLSRSLVALISIQPQDVGLLSKGTRRNRIGEAPGTLITLAASFGCSGFQTGPLFAETGTSIPPRGSDRFVPGRTNRP